MIITYIVLNELIIDIKLIQYTIFSKVYPWLLNVRKKNTLKSEKPYKFKHFFLKIIYFNSLYSTKNIKYNI